MGKTRLALECATMCTYGCGLKQGQSQERKMVSSNPVKLIDISYLWNSFIEKLFEELKLWNVTSREAAQHVKEQLNLIVMLSANTTA